MENLMKCKACGFVTDQRKIKDVCPACGVPAKMFEPYKHPVSITRRRILDLHTHPVAVHFPQAFAVTLSLLSLAAFVAPADLHPPIAATMKVLAVLLPFFLIGAITTGLMDGNLRFRRVNTPLLIRKIVLGMIFFILAVAMTLLALHGLLFISGTHILFTLLALVVSLCGALLGLIGGTLLDAKFPG